MADVETLFQDFAAAFERDRSTDPRPYLEQVEGVDRRELEVRIEAYLERAPRREWDSQAFAGSMAERAVGAAAGAEPWPTLLPRLRDRARLKRAEVVERLAAALGFPDSEQRVAEYLHRMEMGTLPASGVSSRVLEALGGILGSTAEALRRAGEAGDASAAAGGEVFARRGAPVEGMASPGRSAELAYESTADADGAGRREPDELDRLFTEGD